MQPPSFHPEALSALQAQAETEGKQCCVGTLIRDHQGRLLFQQRAPDRHLFPNCRNIIGSHVEPGETLRDALAHEIQEETGWSLARIISLIQVWEWEAQSKGIRREFGFLVEVEGHLEQPRLEEGKHLAFRWIGLEDLPLLKAERLAGDGGIYALARGVLQQLEKEPLQANRD